jgi:hypothetical protein
MEMFRPNGLNKVAAALIAGVALSAATVGVAQADPWHHDHGGYGRGGGWGWNRGAVVVGPGYYYAPPPPVYYAPPPPAYYAPPPPAYYAPPPPVYIAPAPAVSLQFRL